LTKPLLKKRIRDWKKRISNLYATLKSWTKDTDYYLKAGGKIEMYEELMDQFNVPPVQLDTVDLYKNDKLILVFKPKGLWMIGTNGGIDILTFRGGYTLIDMAEPFKAPKWKLYSSDNRTRVDFTKQSFLQLIKQVG
jgi:hypothetical protein